MRYPRGHPRHGAFIVIKSAEGKRTRLHQLITREQFEEQRAVLEKAGIKRVRSALERLHK